MIPASTEELKLEQEISSAIWLWFKKYYHASNCDEHWELIITEGHEIVNRYKTQLVKDLFLTYLDELERHIRGR